MLDEGAKLEKLTKIAANPNQYLVLKHINGKVEHLPG